jgi:hypothetical protein
MPLLARFAWHPDLGIKNLDPYALFKIGCGIGILGGDIAGRGSTIIKEPTGFAIGFDLGARYFFAEHWGTFVEFGYERVFANYKMRDAWGATYAGGSVLSKFFTIGVTYKL